MCITTQPNRKFWALEQPFDKLNLELGVKLDIPDDKSIVTYVESNEVELGLTLVRFDGSAIKCLYCHEKYQPIEIVKDNTKDKDKSKITLINGKCENIKFVINEESKYHDYQVKRKQLQL